MNKFNKISIITVLVVSIAFGSISQNVAVAATTPSLGAASTFGILSNLFQHNIAATTINGDPANAPTDGVLGYSSQAGVGAVVVTNGTTYVNDATWTAAGNAQNAAKVNLDGQACTSIGAAVDLASYDTDGPGGLPPGTFPPGCYSSTGAMSIGGGGTVTLSGSGTYIFRPNGALNTTAGSIVTLSGASACDVFWTPTAATTLGANSTFRGTLIDPSGVTMSNLATVGGRVLAYGGTVTADSNTVTVPVCAVPPPPPAPSGSSSQPRNFTVVKQIINDNGGTATVSDFPLFVNGNAVVSGESVLLPPGAYVVSETSKSNYTATFGGDCNTEGEVNHGSGNTTLCTIVNDDIGPSAPITPPLIDVVKVPSPLALPSGPGPVTYTYTVRNIGTVPMTGVTMVGDTCSPITLISGDTDSDTQLDVSETWIYRCSTTLSATHTNTVTASGWANGLNAIDVASATVVVGAPIVPPLIHVTKVPNRLTVFGGGNVAYAYTITNPGTVAMHNVAISDDRCSQIFWVSGDSNLNNLLEPGEAWAFTCQMNLARTTTNTVSVSGEANGFVVRDFAIVTVAVAGSSVVLLPNTGFAPEAESGIPLMISILIMLGLPLLVITDPRLARAFRSKR